MRSNMSPSTFAYPPMTSNEKKVDEKKAATAVLSTTSKAAKKNEKSAEEIAAEKKAAEEKEAKEKVDAESAAKEAMLAMLEGLKTAGTVGVALYAEVYAPPQSYTPQSASSESVHISSVIVCICPHRLR